LLEKIKDSRRDDGSPLLTPSSAAGILVFFVLAMQCLPTLAVTRKEAGEWKWAILQLVWMSLLAWSLGAAVRLLLMSLGVD
jgi:ferrous iron transport protein B